MRLICFNVCHIVWALRPGFHVSHEWINVDILCNFQGDHFCSDITAGFLADWLAVSEAPETELWFRSSGEMRFSEFLVLQSGYSYIHIDPQLWPAITSWNWIWAVLQFQLKWPYIKVSGYSKQRLVVLLSKHFKRGIRGTAHKCVKCVEEFRKALSCLD